METTLNNNSILDVLCNGISVTQNIEIKSLKSGNVLKATTKKVFAPILKKQIANIKKNTEQINNLIKNSEILTKDQAKEILDSLNKTEIFMPILRNHAIIKDGNADDIVLEFKHCLLEFGNSIDILTEAMEDIVYADDWFKLSKHDDFENEDEAILHLIKDVDRNDRVPKDSLMLKLKNKCK